MCMSREDSGVTAHLYAPVLAAHQCDKYMDESLNFQNPELKKFKLLNLQDAYQK